MSTRPRVRRFAGREVEDERDASGITETTKTNFTDEPVCRLSNAGRLLRPRSGGKRGSSKRYSASLRSPRLNPASLQEAFLS